MNHRRQACLTRLTADGFFAHMPKTAALIARVWGKNVKYPKQRYCALRSRSIRKRALFS